MISGMVRVPLTALRGAKSAMKASPAKQAALHYLSIGWCVVPLRSREKRPLTPWQSYQQKRPSRRQIETWFRDNPDANVGIVTGAVSGLVVLDIDTAHGGEDSVQALEQRYGPIPSTVEALTGGGGRHLYFRHPGGIVPSKVGLAPGIDLRGDGGLVVAPPSIHPSGRYYEWKAARGPDEVMPTAMPTWLLELAASEGEHKGHPLSHWRALVREGVAEGERNNTIASLAGHLLWRGVDAQVALDLLLCWNRVKCRPPLPDDEVAAVVQSIRRLHERQQDANEQDQAGFSPPKDEP